VFTVAVCSAFVPIKKTLTSLQAIAAKRFIQMLCAAYADLTGQPLSFAAKSGSAFVTAPAHTVAT